MKKIKLVLALILFAGISNTFGQANEMQDNIALIKKNLADSKQNLKKYEWIETTTTFVKGEQKSKKQNQCYYSVDGKLTKVETGGSAAAKTPGGLRGKAAANKKQDIQDYIQKALEQINSYMPPDPDKIQQNYADGKTAIQILEPGKKFKLNFPDYLQKGDLLSISLDKENKFLLGYSVKTFVSDPTDVVTFDVVVKALPDGTQYPAEITFNSASQKLKIVMQNSGYKVGGGH